jgi:hypothetical protein
VKTGLPTQFLKNNLTLFWGKHVADCELLFGLRLEGRQGFFKGMLYPILSSGAINSIFFGFYGATLNQLPVRLAIESYPSTGGQIKVIALTR